MEETGAKGGRSELPLHTFKPCGSMPTSDYEQVASCEIVQLASAITREFWQTARLYAWTTGIGEISAIDDASIALFCDRLGKIPSRLGTNVQHFDRPIDALVKATPGLNESSRDSSTIKRHRSRMMKLRTVHVPKLEERVGQGFAVYLDDAECSAIAGWRQRAGFIAVTRMDRVVYGAPLPAFTDDRSADLRPVVRAVLEQACEGHAALKERGRAFVMTSHEGQMMRIVPGFWAPLK